MTLARAFRKCSNSSKANNANASTPSVTAPTSPTVAPGDDPPLYEVEVPSVGTVAEQEECLAQLANNVDASTVQQPERDPLLPLLTICGNDSASRPSNASRCHKHTDAPSSRTGVDGNECQYLLAIITSSRTHHRATPSDFRISEFLGGKPCQS